MSRARALLAVTVCSLAWASRTDAALAHPLSFGVLALREEEAGDVDLVLDVSAGDGEEPSRTVDVTMPDRCRLAGPVVERRTRIALVREARYRCGSRGLAGATIAIGGMDESLQIAVRVDRPGRRPLRMVVDAASPGVLVDAPPSSGAVLRSYASLGVAHILTGADHLLFVLGLVLIARRWRALLVTVTAFTLGHSVSLALATVGVVHVPTAPVEACIALSILLVALEAARARDGAARTLTTRRPYVAAAAFGLLHGLGFAGALAQVGLPEGDVPLALFAFNVGVELGQIAFVVVVLAMLARLPPRARSLAPYIIGSLACYWLLVRLAALGARA